MIARAVVSSASLKEEEGDEDDVLHNNGHTQIEIHVIDFEHTIDGIGVVVVIVGVPRSTFLTFPCA